MKLLSLKSIINASDDEKISWLVAALWGYNIITLFVNTAVNYISRNTPIDTIICYGIVLIFILIATKPILRRLNIIDIVFFLMVALTILVSLLFYNDNYDLIVDILPRFFLNVLPYYFVGRAINEFSKLNYHLKLISIIVIITATLQKIMIVTSGTQLIYDDMSFSYYLLPSVIFMCYYSLENNEVKNWLYALLGITMVVIAGTRGPLVCLSSFFILYFIFHIKNVITFIKFSPIFFGFTYLSLSNKTIEWLSALNNFLINQGLNLRIIQLIIIRDIHNKSGRDIIQSMIIESIKNKPIEGHGLMGDRIASQGFIKTRTTGTYAHNILIEIWCQFGIIIGSLLMLMLFILILYALFKEKNKLARDFILVVIPIGLVKLFLSASYLLEPYFFFLIGLCISSIKLRYSIRLN